MSFLKKVLAGAALIAMTACTTQHFNISGTETPEVFTGDNFSSKDGAKQEKWQSFWVDGIGQARSIDAGKVCGGAARVKAVESQWSALNILVSIVTIGIYAPHQARVYCQ